ncbi:hypothetical protein Pen01_55470 [Phytomonospora endophytica]|nr:hypothetical protein Pen01_55470 [Phytomonospora endophytica]
MTHRHGNDRFSWEGQLTGRAPIIGRGRSRYGAQWWFRADGGGWAFQTLGKGRFLLGARGREGLLVPEAARADHDAAWTVVESCLEAGANDELSPIGEEARGPLWWRGNNEVTDADPLLPGQIRGDRQAQPRGNWFPLHRYADDPRTCRQCGTSFVFTAVEQQHWYEVWKILELAHPSRCARCRRERRAADALGATLGSAFAAVDKDPADAWAHLNLAQATLALRADRAEGDAARAIHAARRALELEATLAAAVDEVITRLRATL